MPRLMILFAIVFSITSLTATSAEYPLFENFHTVEKGRFYRSGTMKPKSLRSKIRSYGIKTVINLRGHNPKSKWYQKEVQVLNSEGVKLINISMSAKTIPHRESLLKLLDAYENAERPILVHCFGGADRAGEASAIYVLDQMGGTREDALKMLTKSYLHFSFWYPAKRYFIGSVYVNRTWMEKYYDLCRRNYKYYNRAACE